MQWCWCNSQQTLNCLLKWQLIYNIADREIKRPGWFLHVLLEKPMHEVCLSEQIFEKRKTIRTHGSAECLLKISSTKHNKCIVIYSSTLIILASEIYFLRIGVVFVVIGFFFFLHNKTRSFLVIFISVTILFVTIIFYMLITPNLEIVL